MLTLSQSISASNNRPTDDSSPKQTTTSSSYYFFFFWPFPPEHVLHKHYSILRGALLAVTGRPLPLHFFVCSSCCGSCYACVSSMLTTCSCMCVCTVSALFGVLLFLLQWHKTKNIDRWLIGGLVNMQGSLWQDRSKQHERWKLAALLSYCGC